MYKNNFYLSLIFCLALGISVAGQGILAEWIPPSGSPPDGNLERPINTGDSAQVKQGSLWLGGETLIGGFGAGLIVEQGMVAIATTVPEATLHVDGDVKIEEDLIIGGADLAEEFSTPEDFEAGSVLVMGDNGYKSAMLSSREYDQSVIGVVSNNAAVIMGEVTSRFKETVAMNGVVDVKVTNKNGAIKKGDLLTTSDIPGYGMKATDYKLGSIFGKALEDATGSDDTIKALINLQ